MNIKKLQLSEIAKNALEEMLDKSGSVLYSSHETIKPGSVYLMGLNPGGSDGLPLSKSIEELLTRNINAYLDEAWENGITSYEPGKAPLQQRIVWLLESLDYNPAEVIATNLIFMQSRDASGISYNMAERCWPVHEALLSIVQPKLILVFGNSGFSPYGFIHKKYGGEQTYIPAGHGDWSIKKFSTKIGGSQVTVVGLPHLSRYDPIGKMYIIDWIK